MMPPRIASAMLLAYSFLALAAEPAPLRSGLQVGEEIPGSFFPLNCNGEDAGQKRCLV